MALTASDPFYSEGRLILCYVYLLLCADDDIHIKIGMSQEPLKRALALRNNCPLPLNTMAVVDLQSRRMALGLERDLHKALANWRTNGEWFKFSLEDKQKFNELTQNALKKYSSKSRLLKWTKINLKELASQATQRKKLAQKRWKRGSRSYRDAVMAGLRP